MTKTVLNAKHITSLSRWCRRDGTEIIQTLTYKAVEPVIVFQFNLCKSSQIITGTGIKDLKLQGGWLGCRSGVKTMRLRPCLVQTGYEGLKTTEKDMETQRRQSSRVKHTLMFVLFFVVKKTLFKVNCSVGKYYRPNTSILCNIYKNIYCFFLW